MLTMRHKLYVQLAPDASGIAYLHDLQLSLNKTQNARLVDNRELHMTVIHIGLLQKLWDSLQPHIAITQQQFLAHCQSLANNLERLVASYELTIFTLPATELSGFGTSGSTLVVKFNATAQLTALHAASLQTLQDFLQDCGLQRPATFMANDSNLQYALPLRPHIALARQYHDSVPQNTINSVKFRTMPVVYSS